MKPNFVSKTTGKEYSLSYKSKVVNGVVKYYERGNGWRELLDSNGEPLSKIEPTEIYPIGVKTETASRF